ncbi:MAG: hypothetical protein VX278_08090, partial [Myxococcota bacterium]|nr:hypothetical protein [Myxococcota bacterium]
MTFLLLLLSCSQEINDPGYTPGAPNPYSNTPPPKLSVILDGNIPIEDLAVICDQETIPHQ